MRLVESASLLTWSAVESHKIVLEHFQIMLQDLDPSVKAILDWRVGVEISKEKQKSVMDRWGLPELG